MKTDLRETFTGKTGEMVELTREFAAIESPTDDKAAVDRFGARVADELEKYDVGVAVGVGVKATTVNPPALAPQSNSRLDTETSYVPGDIPPGTEAVMDVELVTSSFVSAVVPIFADETL